MSYILDALRKAERERHLGQPPTLAAPPLVLEPARRRVGLWLAVGLGLGLNAALLAFFLTRNQPAAPPATAASPAPAVTSTPSTPPASHSLPPARQASGREESPVTAREPAQLVPPTRSAAVTATAPSTAPAPATPHKEPADRLIPELSSPTIPRASRGQREASSRPPLTPGSVSLAPAPESVPSLETLSAGARRGIPALSLDIHVHSADPDKRFVVINGRRYREGEQLSEGPVLESVTREGAILRQGGQHFRLSMRR